MQKTSDWEGNIFLVDPNHRGHRTIGTYYTYRGLTLITYRLARPPTHEQ